MQNFPVGKELKSKSDVLAHLIIKIIMSCFCIFRETKIVLKGDNSAQLTDLAKQAETKGVANYMVQDAGRTQVSELVRCWEKIVPN